MSPCFFAVIAAVIYSAAIVAAAPADNATLYDLKSVDIVENHISTASEEGFQQQRAAELEEAIGALHASNAELLDKMTLMQETVDEQRGSNDELRISMDQLRTSIIELGSSNFRLQASNMELTRKISDAEISDDHVRQMVAKCLRSLANYLLKATSTAPSATVDPGTAIPSPSMSSVHLSMPATTTVSNEEATSIAATASTSLTDTTTAVPSTHSLYPSMPAATAEDMNGSLSSNMTTVNTSSLPPSPPAISAERRESLSRDILHAAAKGNAQKIRQLIAEGANLEYKGWNNYTALHKAALKGHADTIRTLVALSAPLEAETNLKETPLHLAALYQCEDCVKELLSAGAKVNVRNKFGVTPLHYAAGKKSQFIVQMLITAGADREAKNVDGDIPKALATNPDVRALL